MDSCAETPFCRALLERVNTGDRFLSHLQIRLVGLSADGTAVGELTAGPDVENPWGSVHGGALDSLADTVAGTGVVAATGQSCVTVDQSFRYLRPARRGKITCTARPERLGAHLCVMRVELTDEDGDLVAAGAFTFFLTGPLGGEAP